MILSFRSDHLEVFAANQDRYYDIGRDEFVHVKPGFRAAVHARAKGRLHTWVLEGWRVKKLDYQSG